MSVFVTDFLTNCSKLDMIYPKDIEVNELSVQLALALSANVDPDVKPKMEHEDTTSTLAEPVTNEDLDLDDHDPETSEPVAGAKKSKRVLTRRDLCKHSFCVYLCMFVCLIVLFTPFFEN